MKVAKLVLWSPITRVVVEEDATYEQIIEAARSRFQTILDNDYSENIEDVIDDEEYPYSEDEVEVEGLLTGRYYEVTNNKSDHEFSIGEVVRYLGTNGEVSGLFIGQPSSEYPDIHTWLLNKNEVKLVNND